MNRRPFYIQLLTFLVSFLFICHAPIVRAYEAETTHVGLTARAVVLSNLHAVLQRAGVQLGLFETVSLDASALPAYRLQEIWSQLRRFAPNALRQNPDKIPPTQTAIAWITAGSVIQDIETPLERHHFFDPSTDKGLNNASPLTDALVAAISTAEGINTVRNLLTGNAPNLAGLPAQQWLDSQHNPHAISAFYLHFQKAITESSRTTRRHHWALALMALGGILHILQDMGSPTHVRNDFIPGHTQQLNRGSRSRQTVAIRGSAYERYVGVTFGQNGIPRYSVTPVKRPTITAYFSSKEWNGLADHTHKRYLSPGTLPPTLQIKHGETSDEIALRIQRKLRYAKPSIPPLNLNCPEYRVCYGLSKTGEPLFGYAITRKQRISFFLNKKCFASAAQDLLPRVVGFSAGLVEHLFRGDVALTWNGTALIIDGHVPNASTASLQVIAENVAGTRQLITKTTISPSASTASPRFNHQLIPRVPVDTQRIFVVLHGNDRGGDSFISFNSIQVQEK